MLIDILIHPIRQSRHKLHLSGSSRGRDELSAGSGSAPVYTITAVGVVSSPSHVIELADAGHHSAGVLLLQGLAKAVMSVWMAQLNSSCRSMPVSSMSSLICAQARFTSLALCPGDPTFVSYMRDIQCYWTRQDHSGEEFNPVRCLCWGSCHGQSGSVFSRWAISSRWVNNTILANNGNTSGNVGVSPMSGGKDSCDVAQLVEIIQKGIIPHQQQPKNKH